MFEGSSCFTDTDTGSCTNQMLALHAYTAISSTARYDPANCNGDDSARMECSGAQTLCVVALIVLFCECFCKGLSLIHFTLTRTLLFCVCVCLSICVLYFLL